MSSKSFCDRTSCGKEITGVPFRLTLPGHRIKDYCDACAKEYLEWTDSKDMEPKESPTEIK